jgi:dihydroorotase
MYTHTYLGAVPMLDKNGKVRQYLWDARKRGVFLDAGHGGGSFLFRQAIPAVKQGLIPDSISTDLHATSMVGGMKDMTNVMSKFLNMGMTLEQVIRASTWQPARQIKRTDLGHLSVGAPADVAVFSVQKGSFGFVDVYGAKMMGSQMIVAELTMRGGRMRWDLNGLARESWDRLEKDYGPQTSFTWDAVISAGVRGRK